MGKIEEKMVKRGKRLGDWSAEDLALMHWEEGQTLREIGAIIGVSYERVRQILNSEGYGTMPRGAIQRRRAVVLRQEIDDNENLRASVAAYWRAGKRTREIQILLRQHDFELPGWAVKEIVDREISHGEKMKSRRDQIGSWMGGRREMTNEVILEQIRKVAKHIGKTPSINEWTENQKELGLVSSALVQQRFRRWSLAMDAAGLKPNSGTRPGHAQRFDDETFVKGLRECAKYYGDAPSLARYDEWRKTENLKGVYPSAATIRQRYGSWNGFLYQALIEGEHY